MATEMVAGKISVQLGLDASGLKSGLAEAKSSLVEWRDATNAQTRNMLEWGAAITAVIAPVAALGAAAYETYQKLNALTNSAADYNHQMEISAMITGMSAEEMMKWSKVARMAEIDVSTITMSIARLSTRLNDTTKEGKDNQELLKSWGIEVKNTDGSFKDMSEVFPKVINHLRNMSDTTQANIYSQELFSRGFMQLAPLFAMTQKDMESYYNSAKTLTKDEQYRLEVYERQLHTLDGTYAALSRRIGVDLSESMTHAAWATDQFINNHQTGISKLTSVLDQFINYEIFAFEYASEAISYLSTHLNDNIYSANIVTHMKDWTEQWKKSYRDMLSSVDEETNKTKESAFVPSTDPTKVPGYMDQYQIRSMQLEYQRITTRTLPDQKEEVIKLTKEYKSFEEKGTDAAKAIKGRIDDLNISIAENINKISEMESKLRAAGASVTSASSDETYNKIFSTSLIGTGVDWAGESELGNMTADQLQAVIDKASKGGSKAQAEKASQYLSLLRSSPKSSTSSTGSKTPVSPASEAATTSMKTEQDKQLTQTTNYLDQISKLYTDTYTMIEQSSVTHFTALSELARIQMQKLMDDWQQTATYLSNTVAYQQIITVTDGQNSVEPQTYKIAAPPALKQVDFSGVKLTGGSASAETPEKKKETGGIGTGAVINNNITTTIQTADNPSSIASAANLNISRGIAKGLSMGGVLPI